MNRKERLNQIRDQVLNDRDIIVQRVEESRKIAARLRRSAKWNIGFGVGQLIIAMVLGWNEQYAWTLIWLVMAAMFYGMSYRDRESAFDWDDIAERWESLLGDVSKTVDEVTIHIYEEEMMEG